MWSWTSALTERLYSGAFSGVHKLVAPTFSAAFEKHPAITFGRADTEAEQGLAAAVGIRSIV